MKCKFTGKNVTIRDSLKERVEDKLGKLEKFLPENTEATITVSVIKLDHTIEVTIPINKRILRAEVTTDDMFKSVDEVVDRLESQLVRYKGRLRQRSKKDIKFNDEFNYVNIGDSSLKDDDSVVIEKSKKFALKPMDAEEAVMEMELLNHNFYVFRDGRTDEVNVVYKRKNGSYGLIVPEY